MSPWSGIYDLKDFKILTSFKEFAHPSLEKVKTNTYVDDTTKFEKITSIFFDVYSHPEMCLLTLDQKLFGILHNCSSKTTTAWLFTGFGASMWSLFKPVCPS